MDVMGRTGLGLALRGWRKVRIRSWSQFRYRRGLAEGLLLANLWRVGKMRSETRFTLKCTVTELASVAVYQFIAGRETTTQITALYASILLRTSSCGSADATKQTIFEAGINCEMLETANLLSRTRVLVRRDAGPKSDRNPAR